MQPSDNRLAQQFAERKVIALLNAWDGARNPHDPRWRQQYAQAAIAAGLPCHDEHIGTDLGVAGWRAWAGATRPILTPPVPGNSG